jgi:rfaE bifunctional protein nucleotidyltransferase chain/domain
MRTSSPSFRRFLSKLRRDQKKGKRVVFTNGCFDLLHAGHIRVLNQAKNLGDILIVALNSDASVRRLKGKSRPILLLKDRMEIIQSLKCVDHVLSFSEKTPLQLIRTLKPQVLIKGGDWTSADIVGTRDVTKYGGKVVSGIHVKGKSTSQLIKKIRNR